MHDIYAHYLSKYIIYLSTCVCVHMCNEICAYENACIAHVTSSTWVHVYAYMYAQYICTLLGHMCVSMFMHTCISLYIHDIYAYSYACIARFTSSTWAFVYALWMCILGGRDEYRMRLLRKKRQMMAVMGRKQSHGRVHEGWWQWWGSDMEWQQLVGSLIAQMVFCLKKT